MSGPGLTDANKVEAEVAPYIVQNSNHLKKWQKRLIIGKNEEHK